MTFVLTDNDADKDSVLDCGPLQKSLSHKQVSVSLVVGRQTIASVKSRPFVTLRPSGKASSHFRTAKLVFKIHVSFSHETLNVYEQYLSLGGKHRSFFNLIFPDDEVCPT